MKNSLKTTDAAAATQAETIGPNILDQYEKILSKRRDDAKRKRDKATKEFRRTLRQQWDARSEAYGIALQIFRELREEFSK